MLDFLRLDGKVHSGYPNVSCLNVILSHLNLIIKGPVSRSILLNNKMRSTCLVQIYQSRILEEKGTIGQKQD